MQLLWFFLSVFCGILGGCFVLHALYRFTVGILSGLYLRRTKTKESGYGRKS